MFIYLVHIVQFKSQIRKDLVLLSGLYQYLIFLFAFMVSCLGSLFMLTFQSYCLDVHAILSSL